MSKPRIIEMKGNLGGFKLLKGIVPEGHCPECATAHEPQAPHNQQSMAYQYAFREKHGRWPTWHDATRHCTPELRTAWLKALDEHGVDVGADPVQTCACGAVATVIVEGAVNPQCAECAP